MLKNTAVRLRPEVQPESSSLWSKTIGLLHLVQIQSQVRIVRFLSAGRRRTRCRGGEKTKSEGNAIKLYFPLAEERNKWKMFSHTPLGPGREGLFFESHAQCLSVAILLSGIADVYF